MNNSITSLASHLQSAVSDAQTRLSTTHNQIASGKKDLSDQDTSIVARLSAQASSQSGVQGNIKNANNVVDVAQSGLSSIASILTQMQSLATQVLNGLNSDTDQTMLYTTFSNLNSQIAKIAATTSINGNNLLSGNQTISVLSGSDGVNNKTTLIQGVDIASLQTALNALSFAVESIDTTSTSTVTGSAGTPGVYAQQTVSLNAMGSGDTYTISGLTFTAAADLTSTQVAAIFASKIAGTDPSSGIGSFSGSFVGDFSAASSSNVLTLTGTSYGPMSTVSVSGLISGEDNADTAIGLINTFLSQVTSAQSSLSAATDILDLAYSSSTEVAVSSQKSVDTIEGIDLTALQANLQALSVQQSLDFQVISQMNTAASSLLSIFR